MPRGEGGATITNRMSHILQSVKDFIIMKHKGMTSQKRDFIAVIDFSNTIMSKSCKVNRSQLCGSRASVIAFPLSVVWPSYNDLHLRRSLHPTTSVVPLEMLHLQPWPHVSSSPVSRCRPRRLIRAFQDHCPT